MPETYDKGNVLAAGHNLDLLPPDHVGLGPQRIVLSERTAPTVRTA